MRAKKNAGDVHRRSAPSRSVSLSRTGSSRFTNACLYIFLSALPEQSVKPSRLTDKVSSDLLPIALSFAEGCLRRQLMMAGGYCNGDAKCLRLIPWNGEQPLTSAVFAVRVLFGILRVETKFSPIGKRPLFHGKPYAQSPPQFSQPKCLTGLQMSAVQWRAARKAYWHARCIHLFSRRTPRRECDANPENTEGDLSCCV